MTRAWTGDESPTRLPEETLSGSDVERPAAAFLRRAPVALIAVGSALLAGVYFAVGKLGLQLAFVHPSVTPVWPPTGISMAALILFGPRLWPGVLAGAFLVNATTAGNVWTSLALAAGNSLEALVGAGLVRRFCRGRDLGQRVRDVFRFIVLAGSAAVPISATVGVSSLVLGGFAPVQNFGRMWLTWWLGDASSAYLLVPLILTWVTPLRSAGPLVRILEAAVAFVAHSLVSLAVFAGWIPWARKNYPLTFATLPFLIWPAFRFHPFGAPTATFLLAAVAVGGTLRGTGPFALGDLHESLLLLQLFVAVVAVTAMLLNALLWERFRAEKEARTLNLDLERRVTERTERLSETARELDTFAYSVSHDLRAPLRAMTGFSQALLEDFGPRLDPKAREYAERIVRGGQRMNALIEDLLAYSRLTRAELTLVQVDLTGVVDEVLASLAGEVERRGAKVDVARPLHGVQGHPVTLRQVVTNLVSNALKFVAPGVAPRVRVRSESSGGTVRLWVEDNGIGIAPEHHERIFRVFERLHGVDDYPGTGVGLAIVRRGLERMGGRVGVESEPGKGSRFWIELRGSAEPVTPGRAGGS
jgi:signal transduction histidine kinase